MRLPLVSTTSNGVQYRLVGATFVITGTESLTITDTSPDTLVVPLKAGTYSIQLEGEWHLERLSPPFGTVPAVLISPNPMVFSVVERETRDVRFLFKVPADGNVNVGISVDEGGWLAGSFTVDQAFPSPGNEFDGMEGQSIPFTISYDSFTILRHDSWYSKGLLFSSSDVVVQFGAPASAVLYERVAPLLNGADLQFWVYAESNGTFAFGGLELIPQLSSSVTYRIGINGGFIDPAMGLDAEGYPNAVPFEVRDLGMSISNRSAHPEHGIHGTIDVLSISPQ